MPRTSALLHAPLNDFHLPNQSPPSLWDEQAPAGTADTHESTSSSFLPSSEKSGEESAREKAEQELEKEEEEEEAEEKAEEKAEKKEEDADSMKSDEDMKHIEKLRTKLADL
jgi:TATA-binding protein-associated factor Taf7